MEYTKRKRYTIKHEDSALREMYPHDMQFYKIPPKGLLDLKDFQDLGLERRQVLQLVESIVQRKDLKTADDKKKVLLSALRKDGFNYSAKLLNGHGCSSHTDMELHARKRDHVSHYILRLAYCQNAELRRWFISMEVEYFKLRFTSLNKEGTIKLMSLNDLDYEAISPQERDELRENLQMSTAKVSSVDNMEFYKVPFEVVPDLVKGRRVYIHMGFAYIPLPELVSLFVSQFKVLLTNELEIVADNLSIIEGDERLSSYLKTLPNVFAGMTKVIWSNAPMPIEKLDELSKISYPLCMRMLHEALKTDHHLKNGGRLQYGLFIKGIGVTLEDATRFWRTEFTKRVDIDLEKFDKKYSYAIRHYFGKEGKRTNYTPYACQKILANSPGPDDKHGCPFKHMSNDLLKKKLESYGIPTSGASAVAELAKEGDYMLACTKCFDITHKTMPERPILHPNSYFAQSREIIDKALAVSENSQANGDKNSQSVKPRPDKLPLTPSRNAATPSRNLGTPSRNYGTPSRTILTPTAKKVPNNIEPLNIEEMLNDDEMAEMMEDI